MYKVVEGTWWDFQDSGISNDKVIEFIQNSNLEGVFWLNGESNEYDGYCFNNDESIESSAEKSYFLNMIVKVDL